MGFHSFPQHHDPERWRAFVPSELVRIWEGLVYDDGLPYTPEPGTIEARLVEEIELEWTRRTSGTMSLEQARRGLDQLPREER